MEVHKKRRVECASELASALYIVTVSLHSKVLWYRMMGSRSSAWWWKVKLRSCGERTQMLLIAFWPLAWQRRLFRAGGMVLVRHHQNQHDVHPCVIMTETRTKYQNPSTHVKERPLITFRSSCITIEAFNMCLIRFEGNVGRDNRQKSGAVSHVLLSLPSLFPLVCPRFLISFYCERWLDRGRDWSQMFKEISARGGMFCWAQDENNSLSSSFCFRGCLRVKPHSLCTLGFRCLRPVEINI